MWPAQGANLCRHFQYQSGEENDIYMIITSLEERSSLCREKEVGGNGVGCEVCVCGWGVSVGDLNE